jgi:hypothetical protein
MVIRCEVNNIGLNLPEFHSTQELKTRYATTTLIVCKRSVYESVSKLTPWSRVLPEKLIVAQMVKKFLAFDRTQRFITMSTRVGHDPYSEPNESSTHTSAIFFQNPF